MEHQASQIVPPISETGESIKQETWPKSLVESLSNDTLKKCHELGIKVIQDTTRKSLYVTWDNGRKSFLFHCENSTYEYETKIWIENDEIHINACGIIRVISSASEDPRAYIDETQSQNSQLQ